MIAVILKKKLCMHVCKKRLECCKQQDVLPGVYIGVMALMTLSYDP